MINVISYKELGEVNHGWLHARHHFSFGSYRDQNRMGFGVLRVVNDDIIRAGTGFATHPHENMEIITYVREGAISHQDSAGNKGRTVAGDVQVMSAGSGILHSEHNHEEVDTKLYQIWIEPNRYGVKPRWDAYEFPKDTVNNELILLVSGDGQAPLQIYQDATIHAGRISKGDTIRHAIKHQAYILVADGEIEIAGKLAASGDAIEVSEAETIEVTANKSAEILLIDAPAKNTPATI